MKKLPIVIAASVALGVACYLVYNQTANRYEKKLNKALEQKRDEYWDKIGMLEKNVAELEEELAQQKEAIVPSKKLAEVYGQPPSARSSQQTGTDCEISTRQVEAIFTYLDKKQYIKTQDLKGGTSDLFRQVVVELSTHLPLVSGEMKDMVSLTRNVAHFYRVFGEKRIHLFRQIMTNESDIVEPVMATFFSWFLSCHDCSATVEACPSLEVLYQYAGFFLNTLAGKSYLLRRNSKIRVLMTYYSILILDKANDQTLNRHGIDIRHFIYYLFQDITNQKGLLHKKAYLDKLNSLRDKYKATRG